MSQQMDISGGMTPLLKYVRIRLEIQTYHSAQGYIKVLFPSKKVDKSKWGMSLYHRIQLDRLYWIEITYSTYV